MTSKYCDHDQNKVCAILPDCSVSYHKKQSWVTVKMRPKDIAIGIPEFEGHHGEPHSHHTEPHRKKPFILRSHWENPETNGLDM